MRKTKVVPFEFEILRRLKSSDVEWANQRLLVAYSGGRDSAVLLNSLLAIRSRLKFEVSLAHVHHGPSSDKKINSYRAKAAVSAARIAERYDLKIHSLRYSDSELKSEAEFRAARDRLLSECKNDFGYDWLVLGHHADDLLETRLIRLVRGTGPQGLQAMHFLSDQKIRPLLFFTSADIAAYAKSEKLDWLEDPTNSSDQYFRNWIRNTWLPQLESKRSGGAKSLARSLETISEAISSRETTEKETGPEVIKRKEFASLTLVKKREILARVLLEQGARDFSRRQIDEILKRLSGSRKLNQRKMSFEVGGLQWQVNAEQIVAVRL